MNITLKLEKFCKVNMGNNNTEGWTVRAGSPGRGSPAGCAGSAGTGTLTLLGCCVSHPGGPAPPGPVREPQLSESVAEPQGPGALARDRSAFQARAPRGVCPAPDG